MILWCVYSNRVYYKVFVQTFRYAIALWKSWICKYSIRFQIIKFQTFMWSNEQWKILAWYPNKMRRLMLNECLNVSGPIFTRAEHHNRLAVFIVDFELISHLVLMFLLLTLSMSVIFRLIWILVSSYEHSALWCHLDFNLS